VQELQPQVNVCLSEGKGERAERIERGVRACMPMRWRPGRRRGTDGERESPCSMPACLPVVC
jgi:hypothetical protein